MRVIVELLPVEQHVGGVPGEMAALYQDCACAVGKQTQRRRLDVSVFLYGAAQQLFCLGDIRREQRAQRHDGGDERIDGGALH